MWNSLDIPHFVRAGHIFYANILNCYFLLHFCIFVGFYFMVSWNHLLTFIVFYSFALLCGCVLYIILLFAYHLHYLVHMCLNLIILYWRIWRHFWWLNVACSIWPKLKPHFIITWRLSKTGMLGCILNLKSKPLPRLKVFVLGWVLFDINLLISTFSGSRISQRRGFRR